MSEDATGSGSGQLGGVSGPGPAGGASSDPGAGGATGGGATAGGSATGATAGLGGLAGRVPNGGVSLLGRVMAADLPAHDHETPSTGGVIDYLRVDLVTPQAVLGPVTVEGRALDAAATAGNVAVWDAGGLFVPAVAGEPGPAGPQGPAGAPGAQGPAGPAGPGVPAGGTTSQVLTKTSAADYATAWQTPAGGGGGGAVGTDALWDAKGDLAAGTGADAAARLAVGTNGQLLSADSAHATGLAWVANPVTAHAALPDAHHARAHDHTTADGSGVLSNEEHDGYSQYANLVADAATPGTNQLRLYAKDNGSGVATLYYRTETGQIYELPTLTSGGGGSGAPANASYITLAGETRLSAETALGAGVIMSGALSARPAFGTAGRLYLATDTNLVYRDTGSAWETFATRTVATGLATDPLADAKGDVFAASGNDAVGRLALGANGQVLTADSSQSLGVKWAAAASGGLPTTGGTMTGTIAAQGAAVDAGGALAVTSPATAPTDRRLYTAAYGPGDFSTGGAEYGIAFTPTTPLYLVAVRWFKSVDSGALSPTAVRLWDTTATSAAVWTYSGTPPGWESAGTGWKEYRLPSGAPLLVSGRTYVLAYTSGGSNFFFGNSYVPAPDAGLTFVAHRSGTAGTYPATGGAGARGIDGAFRTTTAASDPAASGAVRLPSGAAGSVAWRNAGNTADLTLTADASDRLAYSGTTLQLAGDAAATLQRTAAGALRVDTNLGVGVNPAGWVGRSGLQVGAGGSVSSGAAGGVGLNLGSNSYWDGANKANVSGAGVIVAMGAGDLSVYTAPAVAAGAAQTFTTRLYVAPTGTLTLTPDVGATLIENTGAASTGATILNHNSPIYLRSQVTGVMCSLDNFNSLGDATHRWTAVYAVAGAINTSSQEYKEGITPLSPERAMQAVRDTEAVTFDYVAPTRGPEWYDLPDDPEQAEQVLKDRLTAAPLEAAARHQHGFVAEQADDLFLVGEGQTSPGSSIGVLLAALQQLDQRVQSLEGAA